MIGKSPDGVITSWNPAAERLFGYRSEEVVGRHYDVLIPPENSGTTVTALLPVTEQGAAAPADRAAEPARGHGETILLVEDEAALREATRQILARNGYRVLAAADGPAALAMLDQHRDQVKVLLTDVVMPQMPGKQLADKVRAAYPGIRVLFMSGYTQGLLSAQGVLDQDVHLIEKPFDPAALLTELNEALHARD